MGDSIEPEHASIAGTVGSREALGGTIAGARVCAWLLGIERRVREPLAARCVSTGADGRYRLALEPGRYRVGASAAGKLPMIWKAGAEQPGATQDREQEILSLGYGEARTDVDFALAEGGVELSGTVLDVSGGPIEGALLVASGSGMFMHGMMSTAISDEQGRFALWVTGGEHSLEAIAAGYAPGRQRAQAPNQRVELRLTPESVLLGRVVDASSGEGIAGIAVTPNAGHYGGPKVISDEDGSFRLDGLGPGIYQPEAIGPGVYGRAALPVHVGLGQTSAPVVVRVHPAHRIRGRIIAIDKGLAQASERGCQRGSLQISGGGVSRHVEADEDGWVLVEGLPPGRHDLGVGCTEGAEGTPSINQRLDLHRDLDDERWEFDVTHVTIRGRAVDVHGRGVEFVYIDASGHGGDAHALTPPGGEFELRVREAGRYWITAKFKGMREPVVKLELEVGEAGVDDVELMVGEVAAVRGRVVDQDGNPVAGMQVALCDAAGRPKHWATTDGEGRFGFDAQAPGRWWIALQGEVDMRKKETVGEPVELRADRVAEIVRTIESRRGTIRGTVHAEGGPVEDAWVVAGRGTEELIRDWEIGPILCDLDGRFTLEDLGEGTWTIRAFRTDSGEEASVSGVELGSSISLELAATASLAGRVRQGDRPPEHFELEARSGERRRLHSFYRSEGAFELAGLPAGTWTLKVVAESGSAELEVELASGQRLGDLVLELEPRITVRGRAVDSRTGAPVSSVRIGHQFSSGFRRMVTPSADGTFELDGLPPGRVEVFITPADWRAATYSMQSAVLDLSTEPIEQDIGELPLAGGKIDPDQSPGDLGFEFRIVGFEQGLDHVDERHVEVSKVVAGGPAGLAGLAVGDVITRIDGASVEGRHAAQMGIYLRKIAAGAEIVIDRRDATKITIVAAPAK